MARWTPGFSRVLLASALVVGCMAGRRPAAAQTAPQPPVSLDRKTASNLVVRQEKPDYPPLARMNFIQGRVRLQVLVGRDGKVTEAHVLKGHPFLAASALKTIRNWIYRPYRTTAGPREFITVVEMAFVLRVKSLNMMPPRPEEDLRRQVRPPRVLKRPTELTPNPSVHLRVLINDQGKAIDVAPVEDFPAQFEAARKCVSVWTFQPARFGSLPVPWYLEVDVPAQDSRAAEENSGGR